MKTKRIFAIIISSILLAMLIGCSETEIDKIEVAQSNKISESKVNDTEENDNDSYETYKRIPSIYPSGITIKNIEDGNFKREIVNEVDKSSVKGKEQYENDKLNLSGITEFYFNGFEIKGYELFQVNVMPEVFDYYYVPSPPEGKSIDKNANIMIYPINYIKISIDRLDSSNAYKTVEDIAETFRLSDGIIKDGFFFDESSKSITGFINKTNFYISVPDELNTYEYLRDLADDLIKNAELVDVQHELDVMKKNAD